MKQISFRRILSVSFIALASLAVAQDMQNQTDIQIPNSVDMVGMGGEFTYGVSFDAPAFRGLVPNIGLGYNSSNTSRASSSDVIGFGWSLRGFSMIERRSLGRGLPTFDNGQDLFILGGEPLMACDDASASNPWTGSYPLRYKTDRANASCTAGGNFSTRVESYKRIEFDETANTFTVTNKDGTQYLYESIGDLAGETATSGDLFNMAHNSRWLLTEIQDIQTQANTVTMSYAFASTSDAYAHRPDSIDYAGYSIKFGYESTTKPIARFATGTAYLGEQNNRLSSVVAYNGSTAIRGYQLSYTDSTYLSEPLLTSVTEYGSDLTLNGATISGGTSLPPVEFEYSDDTPAFQTEAWTQAAVPTQVTVVDLDNNGRDDIVFTGTSPTVFEANPYRSVSQEQYGIDCVGWTHNFSSRSAGTVYDNRNNLNFFSDDNPSSLCGEHTRHQRHIFHIARRVRHHADRQYVEVHRH